MPDRRIETIKLELTRALAKAAPDRLGASPELDDHQDLLEFVDSFGFVQLLMTIEVPLGIELDLTTVDLGDIVRFGDLVTFIAERSPATALSEAG
jgi:acyl carrier protein